jgi:hypothetical protein
LEGAGGCALGAMTCMAAVKAIVSMLAAHARRLSRYRR